VSELVRNSATYRRHFENLGYYFALNDYMDASVAVDWRSSANATEFDPGGGATPGNGATAGSTGS
jgi:hypothetical protein